LDKTSKEVNLKGPFIIERKVKWGDCDPAGIIYTPRVLDYAMETLEAWNRDVLGVSWLRLNREMGMGFPTVRAELDFVSAPAADDTVMMELRIGRLGKSSVTFDIVGRDLEDRVYFRTLVVSCLVKKPAFKSMEIPEDFVDRIRSYQIACGDA